MKLFKTSLFSAFISFVRIASGFIASKVVAIYTGPVGVVLIGQFVNFITISLTLANGAITTGIIKYTAENNDDENQLKSLFSTALKISISCSIIVGLLLIIGASLITSYIFHNSIYLNPIRIFGITIIFYSLNTLIISILNGKGNISTYTIVNTLGSLIGLLLTIILVLKFHIIGALYSLVLSQSIVLCVSLFFIYKSNWFNLSYFIQPLSSIFAKKLSHFTIMTLVSSAMLPISQIIIRNFIIKKLGIISAGYWQGMMRISDGYLLLVTTSLATYYLPKLSSLQSKFLLRNEIWNGFKIIIPLIILTSSFIYFLRHEIIDILYTPAFLKMEVLFFFQLLGDIFKIASWLLSYIMIAKAMTKQFILTEIIFTLIFISFSFISIHFYGLKGISFAFFLTYLIYFITIVIFFRTLLFSSKLQ